MSPVASQCCQNPPASASHRTRGQETVIRKESCTRRGCAGPPVSIPRGRHVKCKNPPFVDEDRPAFVMRGPSPVHQFRPFSPAKPGSAAIHRGSHPVIPSDNAASAHSGSCSSHHLWAPREHSDPNTKSSTATLRSFHRVSTPAHLIFSSPVACALCLGTHFISFICCRVFIFYFVLLSSTPLEPDTVFSDPSSFPHQDSTQSTVRSTRELRSVLPRI
jgi:hypothetical protein